MGAAKNQEVEHGDENGKTFQGHELKYVLSHLASELGFELEAAQKYVKRGSDHHKTMSILKVAHLGLWQELLIPCVRERLRSRLSVSVNEYLYDWLPENRQKDISIRFK